MSSHSESELLHEQAAWLAPMRARILRRVAIARRTAVLDLGAGYRAVTDELERRAGGHVVALDIALHPLLATAKTHGNALPTCADGSRLPFPDQSFDLVFCQFVLMWVNNLHAVIREIKRVLKQGGVLVAFEPDYGGMIEHPPEIATRDLWIAALTRARANPHVGRLLPGMLAAHGYEVRVDLLPELLPPSQTRFDLLRTLPLTASERAALSAAEAHDMALTRPWERVAHVPMFVVTAERG